MSDPYTGKESPVEGLTSHLSQAARHTATTVRKTVGKGVRRTIRGIGVPRRGKQKPGSPPGIETSELAQLPSGDQPVPITCIDYGKDNMQIQDITDLNAFLAQHRPDWSEVRWINVDGLTDMQAIQSLAKKYHLHPLAIEDVLHVHQRPKAESYGGTNGELPRLYIVARMLQLIDGHLHSEQISIFLGKHTVLTFQQRKGDVWDAIRSRIAKPESRLRQNDASFLVYALLDAVVDQCFPTLEYYSDELERIEERVLLGKDESVIHQIHDLKHELLLLRREIWPMRELISSLQRQEYETISDNTRIYLRDIYDHAVQVIDLVETYREVAMGLAETWMSAMSNRMNEVMKVLTIIATIFIPMTFIAGVYGMNFHYMPELDWRWAYPSFWGLCLVIAGVMVAYFKHKRWL